MEKENIKSVTKRRTLQLEDYLQDPKQKTLFVGAVTLLLFLFLFIAGVVPAFQSVLAQIKQNNKINDTISFAENKIDDLTSMKKEYDANIDLLNIFDQIFPKENMQNDFFQQILNFAENRNVYIINSNFQSNRREKSLVQDFNVTGKVKSEQISITAEGGKQAILGFVSDVEASNMIMNITNFNLTRKTGRALTDAGTNKEYDLSLTLEYFYRE